MKIRVPRKPANTYQHGNLREALVQAGLKLLSEGGVEGLSLRAAAQLAGVSHAAPYRHFKDKDALVAAIAEQGFRLLTASMRAQLAVLDARHSVDTHERLVALGKGYVGFAWEHLAYFRVIFGGVLAKDRTTPALKEAGRRRSGCCVAAWRTAWPAGICVVATPTRCRWPAGRWCTGSLTCSSTRRSRCHPGRPRKR